MSQEVWVKWQEKGTETFKWHTQKHDRGTSVLIGNQMMLMCSGGHF